MTFYFKWKLVRDPRLISIGLLFLWLVIFLRVPVEQSYWDLDVGKDPEIWSHQWNRDKSLSIWIWEYRPVEQVHWWTAQGDYIFPYGQHRQRIEVETWIPEILVFGVFAIGISWLAWSKGQKIESEPHQTETPRDNMITRPTEPLTSSFWVQRALEAAPLEASSSAPISIARDGAEIGEWPEAEVRALYQQGNLVGTDFYWMLGMPAWAELSTLIKPPQPVRLPSLPTTPVSPEKPRASMKTLYVGYFVGAILFSIMLAGDNLNPGFVIGTWGADVICAGFIWFIYKLIAKPKQPTSFTVFMALSAAVFVLMLIGKM